MKYPGLIYFFDERMKPKMLRGTKSLNPAPTGRLPFGISAIKEGDVNIWFYTKGDETIAVDTGHINWPHTDDLFGKVGIDPLSVKHVLLTHSDVDHCGGIDVKAEKNIFPNAEIHIGKGEIPYLERTLHRQLKLGFIKVYNCVTLPPDTRFIEDGDELMFGSIGVRAIEVPGHTAGHMCYLVDDSILFSGDSIAVNGDGGYAFWRFFSQDTELNLRSLKKLEKELEGVGLKCACTGHSGFVTDVGKLFLHTDEEAFISRKKAFCPDAPYDVFSDR